MLRQTVSSLAKASTRITGLDVVPNAKEVLLERYGAILAKLEEKIPKGTGYRDTLEETVNYHKSIVEASSSIEEIEEKMGLGQVEEVIQMTDGELSLIDKMAEWKPWEAEPVDVRIIQARTGNVLYSQELVDEAHKKSTDETKE
uniref:NADH dehydrogenase [ubiquinone] 1 alpha subcomplex subunit 5 n=1 Tax=Palpitomonas bilix TaxID=652834 RepID=A0A7S3G7Q3_9EUKA|mmetsp:Transcript_28462/g.72535  ORF Transcript_28462/g.72535 Transcript_28462/m.72535 type:complete len:144 (+) Transcript_28462:73-504(+)